MTIAPHLRGLKILVAEDNQYSQHLIKLMLELLGAEVVTANNGEQAIEQFKQHFVDVVLMDVHMPVMDGIAATAHCRIGRRARGSDYRINR